MKYELTFLLNDKEEIKNLKGIVTEQGGKIEKEEDWGEKVLSYPIKNNLKAHFYNYTIEIEKNKATTLKKKLNFNEKLLRHLLLIKE